MKRSKQIYHSNTSTLSLRLWEFTGTALVNLFAFILLLVYLSPLSYMVVTSLKDKAQFQDPNAPIWPVEQVTYTYQGQVYTVYKVPTADGVRELALVAPKRTASDFIDPAHPEVGLIHWEGNWRSLSVAYRTKINLNNYVQLWQAIDYPRVLRNTMTVVALGEIGVLCSSIAVAYGLSRFRIPGGKYLFLLLIATIMIPDSITVVPSYIIFTRVLGWNGSFLPLVVPQFFGSAVYIFLLRQNFKSIPRDLDEAAMLDGAGPLRILRSIILPQSIPVVTTVALLFFFNTWNELRMASLYLGIRQDLQTIAFTAQAFPVIGFTPEVLQTSALFLLIVPIIVLFLSQRFFMRDMIITGLEK
jgi:multiple sugar transport system permease protein